MPIYERGKVRIHYEEMGAGFPLLVIPGGGLNSTIAGLDATHPFNAMKEFKDRLRCIGADLRNANAGQSSGPLEIDRPWDSFTDDHIGLMDHLGINRFMVLGYCIGQPFIWNLIKRAGDRVVAAVLTQPSGHRPEMPTQFYDNNMKGWGPEFVKNCKTPILVLPDDIPPHPYKVAMEVAMLAANSQVSMYPWKDTPEKIPLAVRHIRTFLRANEPAAAQTVQARAAAS